MTALSANGRISIRQRLVIAEIIILNHALKDNSEEFYTKRADFCPIVEVPAPHGRIADMDEAIKCIEEVKGKDAELAISLIEWACGKRTIIEAEVTE